MRRHSLRSMGRALRGSDKLERSPCKTDQSKDWPLSTIASAGGAFCVKLFRLFEECEFGGSGNVEAFVCGDFRGGVVLRFAHGCAGEERYERAKRCNRFRESGFDRRQDEVDGEDGGLFQCLLGCEGGEALAGD